MLYEAQQLNELASYINDMQDPELLRWWGKYNESLGHLDTALQSYQQANDTVAIVRLRCQQEDFVAACEVVEQSDNAAAAFMLARQLEATEQVCTPSILRVGGGRAVHNMNAMKEVRTSSLASSPAATCVPSPDCC